MSEQALAAEVREPLLSLRHASKAFGAVQALEDASIDLFPGEVHGLVGENGAGKSTLVKIFAGFTRRTRGGTPRFRGGGWTSRPGADRAPVTAQ